MCCACARCAGHPEGSQWFCPTGGWSAANTTSSEQVPLDVALRELPEVHSARQSPYRTKAVTQMSISERLLAGSKFCGALDLNEIQQLGKNEKATGRGRMWEKKRNWCCLPDHLPGFPGAIGRLCSRPCWLFEGHCIQICSCLRHSRTMQACVANGLAHAGRFRRLCAA